MKVLAVYPGRFQPFHKGHAQVYKWLKSKFGDVVIATSDKVELPKSPFNFKEKVKMMTLAGVPSNAIKQVTNPYIAREVLKDYDPKTTVLVFAVSQKDMEEDPRFSFKPTKSGKPGYLQPYAGNEKKLQPFGDQIMPKGYVIVTPTFTFDVLGSPATSASELRKQFVSLDNKKQKEFIKDLFGKYDTSVHKLLSTKLPKPKSVKQLKEEITRKQLAPMLDSFVSFASEKLGLKSMPSVRYKTDDDSYNSFAAYNPSSNELSISTANRHPMDIFRSVAHELVHHKQNEDGRLGKDIEKEGATGSDIENEANAEAGKIMRWFAKANPNMFGQSYVVETNTAAIAPVNAIRGLGNVTGEVSPTQISQYVVDNEAETKRMQSNHTSGLWYDDGIDRYWLDKKGSSDYQKKAVKGFKAVRGQLNEGINDPGKLKAIFLAGGPGSGKDYVMNSTLAGEGLKEINSDVAFEYLMQKNGLDMEMPEEERIERDIVRGRAKNITKEQERLALAGRLGVIINGTADDLEKIKTVKKNLEDMGYETMMVFVNTSNEVSRERNVERGKMGKRKVPDGTDKQGVPDNSPNIRQEKWDLAQKNIGELQKIFGNDKFAVIDNTADIRKVGPEEKEKIQTNFNRIRRMAQQFVRAENNNPAAAKWISGEAEKRGVTYQEPKRYKSITQIRQSVPQVVHQPDNELMAQARRLGLSYYGFGRFGRKVNGVNKVLFHSKGGKLVRVQNMNEEKKMKNDPCWKGYQMIGKKKKNGKEVPNCVPVDEAFEDFVSEANGNKPSERELGTKSLTNVYKKMTPGEKKKKLSQEAAEASVQGGMNFGADGIGPTIGVPRAGTPYGFGYGSAYSVGLSESIVAWMQSEKTQQKFADKYGDLWEEKLVEAALRLEEAGCGCKHSDKKSIKKLREGMEGGVNNMSMIPTQRKDDVNETSKEDIIDTSKIKSMKAYKKEIHPESKAEKESLKEEKSPAWTRKEGKSESGGLNRKGIASYRRANPGSKLSMAVTTKPSKLKKGSKAANRRKSFCARMGGMKKRLTSAKTARDPNSRINKALRKWNCEE